MNRYLFTIGFLLSLFAFTVLSGCIKPDDFPDEPRIVSVAVSKTTIQQLEESFIISIEFEDGDGDLGYPDDDPQSSIFAIDSRTGFEDAFILTDISPDGNVKSISGSIDVTIISECCIPISGIACDPSADYNPTDEVSYEVYIVDRAGNESNRVQTPAISIVCPQ